MKTQAGQFSMRDFSVQPATDEVEFSQIFRTLWRGKLWIALIAFLGLFAGGVYAYLMATPKFTASADVAFESREEQFVDLESIVGSMNNDQVTLNTEIEVLRSRLMMGKLVRELDLTKDKEFNWYLQEEPRFSVGKGVGFLRNLILGPAPDLPPPSETEMLNATINSVLGSISITNVRQSFVFRIRVTTEEAEKSAQIANTLAELYILDQLEQKFEATERATEWLSERVGILQQELETAAQAVKNFNASSAVVSAEQLEALNRQIKELRARAVQARDEAAASSAELAQIETAAKSGDFALLAELSGDRSLTRLLERAQSDASQSALVEVRAAELVEQARQMADRAQSQVGIFDGSIRQLETQLTQQSQELVQLQQLEREAEASRLIYEYFLGRLKETSVQQGIQQADSRVLSHAVVPLGPSAPRKGMILVLSLLLGTFAGVAVVLGRELAQNTIRKAEDLENMTGLTVMGQIPMVPMSRRRSPIKYMVEKPTSAAAEAIRNLRTSTLLSNVDNPPRVIMVTSSIPAEGKTTQSLALAQNFAGLGKKTLLIEGDIRRRVFADYFEVKQDKGMMAVLSGENTLDEVTFHSDLLDCDVLIGEKSHVNAADVFSSASFRKLLETARETYDYVVIDTPPVLVVPDARVIGQSVDAILYAVRWDSTTTRQVMEGVKSFDSVNLRVTGLFLTQINVQRLMRYGLGDGYGAYGKYGRGYYDN